MADIYIVAYGINTEETSSSIIADKDNEKRPEEATSEIGFQFNYYSSVRECKTPTQKLIEIIPAINSSPRRQETKPNEEYLIDPLELKKSIFLAMPMKDFNNQVLKCIKKGYKVLDLREETRPNRQFGHF